MLRSFYMSGFRNLTEQSILIDSSLVVIAGNNGAGKTSLLEAIYTLLNGKSFRTSKTKHMVQLDDGRGFFVLRAELENDGLSSESPRLTTLAIKKSSSEKYLAKIDGEPVSSISELASVLPTLIVEPRTFNVLEGGAKSRRRLLDWGVFHVEHHFSDLWRSFSKVLKQRNSILRSDNIDARLLQSWDEQFVTLSQDLNEARLEIFNDLKSVFRKHLNELVSPELNKNIDIKFFSGWDSKKSLAVALDEVKQKDILRKTSSIGAQRADLRITYQSLPINEGLSRGQQKLVVLALMLSLIELVKDKCDKQTLIMFDDLFAELDDDNALRFFNRLGDYKSSVIITTPRTDEALGFIGRTSLTDKPKMFHVEHGKLQELA